MGPQGFSRVSLMDNTPLLLALDTPCTDPVQEAQAVGPFGMLHLHGKGATWRLWAGPSSAHLDYVGEIFRTWQENGEHVCTNTLRQMFVLLPPVLCSKEREESGAKKAVAAEKS